MVSDSNSPQTVCATREVSLSRFLKDPRTREMFHRVVIADVLAHVYKHCEISDMLEQDLGR